MKYINLGSTGIKVSELCLGCMTFGVPERGERPWTKAPYVPHTIVGHS